MNVYELVNDSERFERLGVDEANHLDQFRKQPLAEPFGSRWIPVEVSAIPPDDEAYSGPLPGGDFVGFAAGRIALSAKPMATCADLFERYGELLPLRPTDRDQELFWFHCTTLIDALDESRTLSKRFADGRMYMFERLWFCADRLHDAMLFQVPQAGAYLLCTDNFKQQIESLGLTGLIFWLKWSDEPAGLKKIGDWEQMAYKGSMPPLPVP